MPWNQSDRKSAIRIIKQYEVLPQSNTILKVDAKIKDLLSNPSDVQEINRLISLLNTKEQVSEKYLVDFDFLNYLIFEINIRNRS